MAFAADRSVWVGEWHTHPTGRPVPSARDTATYRGLLDDPELGFHSVIAVIFAPQQGRWTGAAWTCHSGRITPAQLTISSMDGPPLRTPFLDRSSRPPHPWCPRHRTTAPLAARIAQPIRYAPAAHISEFTAQARVRAQCCRCHVGHSPRLLNNEKSVTMSCRSRPPWPGRGSGRRRAGRRG
ncbi:Mov34/MPN/PAD-1 family protein [Streptomyces sp. NPDC044780]|uniref:Mov34/MPN/PAD-1 family protein n=1 Tax=Streptomyces sp. NPDC044780 TaxID=3157199 RepID=UPI0033EE392D